MHTGNYVLILISEKSNKKGILCTHVYIYIYIVEYVYKYRSMYIYRQLANIRR